MMGAQFDSYTEKAVPENTDLLLILDSDDATTKKVQVGSLPSVGGGSSGFTDGGSIVYTTTITDNVGIGTTAAPTKLNVLGTVTATAFTGDGSALTGISSGDSGWADGGVDVALTTSTDNVGIGTTTATGKLDVRGDEARIWTGVGSNANATSSGELYVESDLEVDGTIYGGLTGNASTATALSANGSNCSSGQAPLGVDASGAVENCFDAATQSELDALTTAAGWTDGGTTVYATVTTDAVAIGATTAIGRLTIKGQNVHYVGCSDSIQTAVTAATAGDTLILGACTYTISSSITGDKSLTIRGQGVGKTIISSGSSSASHFSWTADGLTIANISFRGTRLANVISMDLTATTSSTGINNYFSNLDINVSDTVDRVSAGIRLLDTGATITDTFIHMDGVDWGSSGQNYGIILDADSTMDTDVYLDIRDVRIENISTDSSGNSASILRGIRFYNVLNGNNPYNMYLNVDHVSIKVRDDSTNAIEGLHMQGARVYAEINNSMIDGYGLGSSFASQNKRNDVRCDDGAECRFRNTVLATGFFQESSGTIIREGFYLGSGIRLDQSTQEKGASNGVDAKPVFQATGAVGSDASGTTSATAGDGAGVTFSLGAGGVSTAATTTGTSGDGGSFTITTGAGGAQTAATATTNVGGVGGVLSLIGGSGGAANSAATTNTGGAGGHIYLKGGVGGVGTTTSGIDGNVYLAINSSGTQTGKVVVGSISSSSSAGVFNVVGTSYFNGNVGIGTVSPVAKAHVTQTAAADAFRVGDVAGDTTPFIIDQNGNVGIGTTVPSNSLEILSGTIRAVGIGTTSVQQLCITADRKIGVFDGAFAGACSAP